MFYVMLFLIVVLLQLRLGASYNLKSVHDVLISEEMTFNSSFVNYNTSMVDKTYTFKQIKTTDQVIDWLRVQIIPVLLSDSRPITYNNYIFGEPKLRISVTKLEVRNNRNSDTKEVQPTYIFSRFWEYTNEYKSDTQDRTQYGNYTFHNFGDKDTPNFRGGYIIDFNGTDDEIWEQYDDMIKFINDSPSWAVIF